MDSLMKDGVIQNNLFGVLFTGGSSHEYIRCHPLPGDGSSISVLLFCTVSHILVPCFVHGLTRVPYCHGKTSRR